MEGWGYDTFALDEAAQGRALSVLAFALMRRTGLVEHFRLDEARLVRFLVRVEDGYPGEGAVCLQAPPDAQCRSLR